MTNLNFLSKVKTFCAIVTVILMVNIAVAQQNHLPNNNSGNLARRSKDVFPKGEKITNNHFSGDVWLQMLSTDNPLNAPVANVTFAPKARNNWHSHEVGQILIVTSGEGWYQEWNKTARKLKEGDVVNIPANVKHWHGATSNSWFVHLAITQGKTTWFEPLKEELLTLAKEVAALFDYYDKISPSIPNMVTGPSEIGGQCGDYALAFVNKWNKTHQDEAVLVIQQQGLNGFPDGLYEVIGKDERNLPFLKDRTTSLLYVWNGIKGLGHPQLGGYKIRLIKELYIESHFDIPNWGDNGPHVWVLVGDISIDPTYADTGALPIIGKDKW